MRRARDILREDKGVSIVFAVLLVVVLLILGGIVLSYGYSNFHRATTDVTSEQNYQTVSSAAKLVRKELDGATITTVTQSNGSSSSTGSPSWVYPWLFNKTSQNVTATIFSTVVTATATSQGSGDLYTIQCSEAGSDSSIILEFPINLTKSSSTKKRVTTTVWTVSSKASDGSITKVGE